MDKTTDNDDTPPNLTPGKTQILLFAIGFVAVSMQFIYMRQVAPFVGSSTIIASIVVSVFLAALALGLSYGGSVTKNHLDKLSKNLFLSSILLGIGSSYFTVELFFREYFSFFTGDSEFLSIFYNPTAAVFIFLMISMFPLVFVVEQSVPLLMNFMKQDRASKVAGDAFNKSTWGNVLGGAATTLVFMYFLGLAWTITLNTLILGLIAISIAPKSMKMLGCIFLALTMLITYTLNVSFESAVFRKTTAYANYTVVTDNGTKHLVTNHNLSSAIGKNGETHEYMEFIRKHVLAKNSGNTILVLGAGGFTLSHDGSKGKEITYVDIDPQIKNIAETHFLKKKIDGDFEGIDARSYLMSSENLWDSIVIDAYTGMNSIPQSLLTQEFHLSVKSRLKPNGRAYYNFIMNPNMSDKYSRGIDNTLRSVYGACFAYPLNMDAIITNVVFICSNNTLEGYDTVYIDDNNIHELNMFSFNLENMSRKY